MEFCIHVRGGRCPPAARLLAQDAALLNWRAGRHPSRASAFSQCLHRGSRRPSGGPAHRLAGHCPAGRSARSSQLHGSQHRRRSSHNATTTWGPMPLRDARRASQTWPRWRVNTSVGQHHRQVWGASSPRRVSSMATIRSAKRIKHSRLLCLPLQIQSAWAGLHCLKQGTSAWTSAHAVVGLWSVG